MIEANPDTEHGKLLLEILQMFDSAIAWTSAQVRGWCDNPSGVDVKELRALVKQRMSAHYDRRAGILRETHPLGVQVNLATGVANGVLVVRTPEMCSQLIRDVALRLLEFEIVADDKLICLKERRSGSVFRVVTRDTMLTNVFWNFYLDPVE